MQPSRSGALCADDQKGPYRPSVNVRRCLHDHVVTLKRLSIEKLLPARPHKAGRPSSFFAHEPDSYLVEYRGRKVLPALAVHIGPKQPFHLSNGEIALLHLAKVMLLRQHVQRFSPGPWPAEAFERIRHLPIGIRLSVILQVIFDQFLRRRIALNAHLC